MGRGFIEDTTLTAIADAIREKAKTEARMKPSEMADLILGIRGGIWLGERSRALHVYGEL